MYLTTHRVRADSGATGYNGFLYLHGDAIRPESLDPDRVSEEPPGECVAEIVSIPRGGNQVDAYLDVVAPDSIGADDMEKALGRFIRDLSDDGPPKTVVWTEDDLAVRCFVSERTPGSVSQEGGRLVRTALKLVTQHGPQPPLIIEERKRPPRVTYEIAESSAEHLPEDERVPGVEMLDPEHEGLEDTHGSVYPLLVDMLFPPDSEAPERFSRVVVKDADGDVLWRSDRA